MDEGGQGENIGVSFNKLGMSIMRLNIGCITSNQKKRTNYSVETQTIGKQEMTRKNGKEKRLTPVISFITNVKPTHQSQTISKWITNKQTEPIQTKSPDAVICFLQRYIVNQTTQTGSKQSDTKRHTR